MDAVVNGRFVNKVPGELKKGNNSNKMLDRVVFSCQQNGVNTFYKCIEFQVNSFDSYWEILIILKQYPKFLCTMPKQGQITLDIQITGSPALLQWVPHLIVNRYVEFHFNAYHNYWEIVFFKEILSQKGGITQIKYWMELSSLSTDWGQHFLQVYWVSS
jgi:hypothetical protein